MTDVAAVLILPFGKTKVFSCRAKATTAMIELGARSMLCPIPGESEASFLKRCRLAGATIGLLEVGFESLSKRR